MGDTNAAAALLESNTNLAFAGENFSKLPLLEAAAAGNVPLVKRLIQLGADINATGDTRMSGGSQMTALHEAIKYNRRQVCQLLLESGANPNVMAFGFTSPLHLAFSENREEMAGWPPGCWGKTPSIPWEKSRCKSREHRNGRNAA